MYDGPGAAKFVGAPVQLEVFKFEPFRRHFLAPPPILSDRIIEYPRGGTEKLKEIFRRSPLSYCPAPTRMRVKCARPDQIIVEEGLFGRG
jgi:hypothetical protein